MIPLQQDAPMALRVRASVVDNDIHFYFEISILGKWDN